MGFFCSLFPWLQLTVLLRMHVVRGGMEGRRSIHVVSVLNRSRSLARHFPQSGRTALSRAVSQDRNGVLSALISAKVSLDAADKVWLSVGFV